MDLKKAYEEMPDEELLGRYEKLHTYFDDAKLVIIEEVKKRKLKTEEETGEKLKKAKYIEEEGKRPKLKKTQIRNKTPNKNTYSNTGNFITRGLVIFLLAGLIGITGSITLFFIGFPTLFWKETNATITNVIETVKIREVRKRDADKSPTYIDRDIEYKYIIGGNEFIGSRVSYDNSAKHGKTEDLLFSHSKGDRITIKYDPNNPSDSVVYGYSLFELIWILVGLLLIKIFFITVKMAQNEFDDFDIIKNKKDMMKLVIIVEIIICVIFIPVILSGQ